MRAALGEAAGIKGDDAIGFTQPINYLSNQNVDQRAMIPGRRADEVWHDLSFDWTKVAISSALLRLIAACLAYIWMIYLGSLCEKDGWREVLGFPYDDFNLYPYGFLAHPL
jgi:hypothetical protein